MMGYLKITAAADADGARLEVIGAVTTEIGFLGLIDRIFKLQCICRREDRGRWKGGTFSGEHKYTEC